MTWSAVNISTVCQLHPTLPSCQPSILAFMAFVVQNFGHSYDDIYSDVNKNNNFHGSEQYDFIIVGGGTAGCVVANRLSEVKHWRILLLEAGGEEPIVADVPGFATNLAGSSVDWRYQSEVERFSCANSNGRCHITRGKVMGGSSTLNAMAYVRGNIEDFNDWARMGNYGWSYEDVLPYFLKSEDNRNKEIVKNDPKRHKTGGYLTVGSFPYVDKNDRAIIEAWEELGLKQIDYNSQDQIGVNYFQSTVINGARQSSNGAFIRPIRGKRSNLVVKTNSVATKILIDPNTKRAYGVEYSSSGDKNNLFQAYARKEVIVSGGTFESPKLLMLSGIGHKNELKKVGIDVIKDLPVGDNLQDHVLFPSAVGILENTSTIVSPSEMRNDAAQWLGTHNGPLSSIGSLSNTISFLQTPYEKRKGVPDMQIYHLQHILKEIELMNDLNGLGYSYYPIVYYDAVTLNSALISVKSRGTVRLNDTDPIWSHPKISLNYLTHPDDVKTIVKGAQVANQIFETRAFKKRRIKKYRKPAKGCENFRFESSEYFECVAKTHSRSGLHLTGTCKMGPKNDPTAVVDPELRVYGIQGLRVIDASIMPIVPKGNAYCPTIMVAEKGSDLIKNEWL